MSKVYQIYGQRLASDFPFKTKLVAGTGVPDLTFSLVLSAPPYHKWQAIDPVIDYPNIRLYQCDRYDVLHVVDLIDFYIFPDQIIAHLHDQTYDYQVEVLLLGLVLSYWLEKRNIRAFHASAVNLNGVAVGFLSTNAGGKSSLAATLTQMGYPLLTDDILSVKKSNDQYIAYPSFPQMRMWPHVAQHFVGGYEDLELAHPAYDKRRVPVNIIGDFCTESIPLDRIYFPQRLESPTAVMQIERIPLGQAMIDLLANSFAVHYVEYAELQAQRFASLSHLVQHIPVYKLSYPSGLHLLPEVCEYLID